MTYSQINHAKGWGFSRRTPNLNLSLCSKGRLLAKGIRGVPLNEQPSIFGDASGQTKIGDFS